MTHPDLPAEQAYLDEAYDSLDRMRDALLADERRQELEQLVAVQRPLAQEQQRGRLGEPLDARLHLPLPIDRAACAGATASVVMSSHADECMSKTYVCVE